MAQATSRGPTFAVWARNVSILRRPDEFLESLLERLRGARRRVVVAALYLGVTARCQRVADALDAALAKNDQLRVTILVDYGRGLRKENGVSVMTLLTPLITKYGQGRVRTCMFMVPLCGAMFRHAPATIREVAGVQHMKAVVVDDDTLITGANLNDDYFTNRQDRYIWIAAQPNLADWTERFISAVAAMSFLCVPQAGGGGDVEPTFPQDMSHPIYSGPSPSPVHEFSEDLSARLSELLGYSEDGSVEGDTFVVPHAQLAAVGVDHDGDLLRAVLAVLPGGVPLTLSTAYPNFTPCLGDALRATAADVHLIAPANDANGFHGASGAKALVPLAYAELLAGFTRRVGRVASVREWSQPGWSYHVKGLWLPGLTVVGSSNYGHRSRDLDAELQFVIATASDDLAARLDGELEAIARHARPVASDAVRRETLTLKEKLLLAFVTRVLYPFL